MNTQDKIWLWICAIVSISMGLIFALNNTSAGWFLVILGISYIAASSNTVQKWAKSRPNLARFGLLGITLFALLLVVGTVAVMVM